MRPDGVTLIPWSNGKCLAWDVTVPDTYAASHVQATSVNPGAAANQAASAKEMKYATIMQTHLFIPIAIETAGVWHKPAMEFVEELGRKTAEVTGDPSETSYIFQRISVAIQRSNAICFAGTFPQD